MAKIPLHPKNPDRICWGCTNYCTADHLRCGNGTERTQHPAELFGDDWDQWALGAVPDVPDNFFPLENLKVAPEEIDAPPNQFSGNVSPENRAHK